MKNPAKEASIVPVESMCEVSEAWWIEQRSNCTRNRSHSVAPPERSACSRSAPRMAAAKSSIFVSFAARTRGDCWEPKPSIPCLRDAPHVRSRLLHGDGKQSTPPGQGLPRRGRARALLWTPGGDFRRRRYEMQRPQPARCRPGAGVYPGGTAGGDRIIALLLSILMPAADQGARACPTGRRASAICTSCTSAC